MAVILLTMIVAGADSGLQIDLQRGSAGEIETKAQLLRLLQQYDTKDFTFTKHVVLDERAIPHSHPVLTLHTRHLHQDDELLSTYLHEQLHWFLEMNRGKTAAAEAELRKIYPRVPFGNSDGAQDEESTYLHLIVCYLEEQADIRLLGQTKTALVMKFWAGDHYKWIYKTVTSDGPKIEDVLHKQHLEISDAIAATK